MDYLDQELTFYNDRIEVKASGVQVMMSWERPLMRRLAQIACMRRGDVLEIGFGMGISADEVQALRPRSHTIIEAHPQIIERALAWARDKPNTQIIGGLWQDVVADLDTYDGIAFDIFAGKNQRLDFFGQLDALLRAHGVASLWLGDERDLPSELREVLESQGFTYSLSKVAAIPDKRCTYSQSNEFYLPTIYRGAHI